MEKNKCKHAQLGIWWQEMGEVYAELWIKIKKEPEMNEEKILGKWQQLIKSFQKKGIDVNDDTSSFADPNEVQVPPNEIWVGFG